MKLRFPLLTTGALLFLTGSAVSQDTPDPKPSVELPKITYPDPVTEAQKEAVGKHREGAQNLAGEQDELAADVQDLIEEQTDEEDDRAPRKAKKASGRTGKSVLLL